MRIIIPLLLAVFGLALGLYAGIALKPETAKHASSPEHETTQGPPEYVKLNDQLVIPLIEGGQVTSMVLIALTLEIPHGANDTVLAKEPKLRDAFLQTLFSHANAGGFKGSFTDTTTMETLRKALKESAIQIAGPQINDVLITDIMRQDS